MKVSDVSDPSPSLTLRASSLLPGSAVAQLELDTNLPGVCRR